jgi:hypothetical protein
VVVLGCRFIFKEVSVPIVAVFHSPNFTQEQYDESVRQLTGGKKLESPADWPVAGLLAHVAGDSGKGFRVVDVWESDEAFQRFSEQLEPITKAIGIDAIPEIYKTQTFVSA